MFNRAFFIGKVMSITLIVSPLAFANDKFEKVTEVEGISEYTLDNGLRVLLFPDQTKETVTVNVTYHVGSKHENYGETGMAHLLEHLVLKGSPKHKDIPAELSFMVLVPMALIGLTAQTISKPSQPTKKKLIWL
jgi:zinc protease